MFKIFSFTGLSTLIKIITGYISVKIVASIIGPSGVALIGQLQNVTSIFTTFGAGGINNGVIKYVSEFKNEETILKKFLYVGFKITFVLSLFLGLLIIVFCSYLSKIILLDPKYYYVFIFLGISLLPLSLNNYFLSILNGFKEFKKFVIINIITSILGLLFTVFLVVKFQLKGALIANVTYQSIILFVTIFFIRKYFWFSKEFFLGKWDKLTIKKYSSYSLMALISVVTVPVTQMLVRGYIINKYSIQQAGFWEGINRISGLYLLFVTTSVGVYYLPKLSEIKVDSLLRKEIFKTYKIITPIIFVCLVLIYLFRELIVNILFTKEFYPMKDLFFWQLLGDFFKIMSWLLGFLMIAKSMTKMYIITETVFAILLILISYYFINLNGVIGATQSYCLIYFMHLITMICIFKNLIFSKN
ncbi:polysaccharide transporter, PST family [Chryseobacterium ureilyticum]|uniref:Polysaccharide transporter, PST family n=1 Tax=Chryseobacterium ureilyticum TaxID=373668 RepID=A0A1N7LX25_9FLAO|nr:O-antigen translocase [Chryseobacterium ureilyticum]SIS78386.1 polysaccharide transporter, PST family [Chryseobacterium ureilyticum]